MFREVYVFSGVRRLNAVRKYRALASLVLIFTVAGTASAQKVVSKPYNDAAKRLCVALEDGGERCLGSDDIPVVTRRSVMTKGYYIALAIGAATSVLDLEVSQMAFRRGATEWNPLLGTSRKQAYPVKLALSLGAGAIGFYYWRKWDEEDRRLGIPHSKWRFVALASLQPGTNLVVSGINLARMPSLHVQPSN